MFYYYAMQDYAIEMLKLICKCKNLYAFILASQVIHASHFTYFFIGTKRFKLQNKFKYNVDINSNTMLYSQIQC